MGEIKRINRLWVSRNALIGRYLYSLTQPYIPPQRTTYVQLDLADRYGMTNIHDMFSVN